MIKPFHLSVSKKTLNEIYKKIKNYPWKNIENINGWTHGTNYNYLKKISKFWHSKYNWKKYENEINSFSNYITNVNGVKIHFIREKSNNPKSKPLLLMHGWPGSIIEFFNLIPKLAHPERFGGKKEDGFDVIVPSFPGFGFSSSIKMPIGPRKMAKILNKLMTNNLNYKEYFAQGGDWGATISNWLAYDHDRNCKAIHINCLTMRHPKGCKTIREKKWELQFINDQIIQDGYRVQQATKPQSLSYAMIDSPVGTAAWILEKFFSWSDLKKNNIESVYSKNLLLTNIMIYILTSSFNTSSWIYYGRRQEGGRFFPKKFKKINVPTGIAIFPKEMSEWPPKSYLERIFNIQHWSKMKKGGHFAALEQPDLLIKDLRKFLRCLRYDPYSHTGRGGSI